MNAKPMVPHREMITEAFRGLGGLGAIGASEAIEAIKLRRDGNPHLQRFNGDPQRINWAYCMVGGDSVVHLSGLVLLARALATGEVTLILQAFQNKSFASKPTRE